MSGISPQYAEALALQVLTWLVGDPDRAGAFLAAAGVGPDGLRQAASDPGFLGAVLDFVLMEDESVLAAAKAIDQPPEAIAGIRAALPGGDAPHWT